MCHINQNFELSCQKSLKKKGWSAHYDYLYNCKMNLSSIDDLYEVNFCRSGELEWRVKGEARKNSQVYQGPFNRHVHAAGCDSVTYMGYDEICNESCLTHRLSESRRTKLGVGLPKDIHVFHLKELRAGVGYWKDYSWSS